MVALPILKGLVADETANFRISLPINFEPVVLQTGISAGHLRAAPGITSVAATSYGKDRGSIDWLGTHYRVIGSKLVSITGVTVLVLGDVGDNGLPVSLDYSFDRLAIASNGNLFYWDGTTLSQVTDTDLGTVLDVMFIDGRFATTDGSYIVLTDLDNPYAVDPLRYGSAETSPDPLVALRNIRGEMYAIGTNTIQNLRNIGGSGFPYQNNPGAMIPKGAVGTHAVCNFIDTFAFVGSAKDEAPSVFLAGGGEAISIGTPDIERELAALSQAELALVEIEARQEEGEQRLIIHLPSKSLAYLHATSKQSGEPVWCQLNGGALCEQPYPLRHLVLTGGKWFGGTSDGRIGVLDYGVEAQFGALTGWRFDTLLIYNQSLGGILHQLELIGLPGRVPFGSVPVAFLSTTVDGETWSAEREIETGRPGEREKRCQWRPHRRFTNYMGLRFRGAGNGRSSWARLEATIEGLSA